MMIFGWGVFEERAYSRGVGLIKLSETWQYKFNFKPPFFIIEKEYSQYQYVTMFSSSSTIS